MINIEKEYEMRIRTNDSRAWCRGCHKQLKPRQAIMIESCNYWNHDNGLVMCDVCLNKLMIDINEYIKRKEQ
jgi:RNase P subunit RPR2